MTFSQNFINNSNDKTNQSKNNFEKDSIENLEYLYPNGHRITHQMKWFKGSRDRGLRSDVAA
tara:strand:+ start:477 stop:662 length:186 start_codon:yes stop_codon:yes gene_type:complete